MVKLKRYRINNFFVLLPFITVFFAEMVSFTNQSLGASIKFASILYMFFYVLMKRQVNSKLFFFLILFLPLLLFHILISFNFYAAIEEAIRYLFPIIILFYGYSVRSKYKLIIDFVLVYALLNNIYQPIVYYNWLSDVPHQWFYNRVEGTDIYYYNTSMGIIRAVGLLGFFATFGFLNIVAFFLTRQFYKRKYKSLLLLIFALGVFLSLSFKAIGVFVLLLFIYSKYKDKILITGVSIVLVLLTLFPKSLYNFIDQFAFRIETYVTEGNSARAESYRVMFEDIIHFKLLGRGSGSFGGASSTKYNSPVYKEVEFNWHETSYLATTDTYFPHLFVELGIIGALFYLLVLLSPFLVRILNKEIFLILFVIYFTLFFDSLFSFAMNNLAYLMLSLVLVYPILEYEKSTCIRKYSK